MRITVWKPVVGYEGLYMVSDTGFVRSLFRYKKVLKYNISKRGYATVELFKDGSSKRLLVHRLVAQAFIPNPDNLPQVNHIDENSLNNTVGNLEWCTPEYNLHYGTRINRIKAHNDYSSELQKQRARENGMSKSKPITQILPNGHEIRYQSINQAIRITGIRHISEAAKGGKYKTAGGCKWKYEGG